MVESWEAWLSTVAQLPTPEQLEGGMQRRGLWRDAAGSRAGGGPQGGRATTGWRRRKPGMDASEGQLSNAEEGSDSREMMMDDNSTTQGMLVQSTVDGRIESVVGATGSECWYTVGCTSTGPATVGQLGYGGPSGPLVLRHPLPCLTLLQRAKSEPAAAVEMPAPSLVTVGEGRGSENAASSLSLNLTLLSLRDQPSTTVFEPLMMTGKGEEVQPRMVINPTPSRL